jgi:hypothetical protein
MTAAKSIDNTNASLDSCSLQAYVIQTRGLTYYVRKTIEVPFPNVQERSVIH